MSLIKFPTHIEPARLTVRLQRVDEINSSPLTNAQQVLGRGNPAWVWTYEYVDLTNDEREIVQAFLLKCRGALNTFKVPDFGDYGIRGVMSDWNDVFDGQGEFSTLVGSVAGEINSYFSSSTKFRNHIGEEQSLNQEWQSSWGSDVGVKWKGDGGTNGYVAGLEPGAAYVQRIKFFQNPDIIAQRFTMAVGSGGGQVNMMEGPNNPVGSSDSITVPFMAGEDVSSYNVTVRVNDVNGQRRSPWQFADYRLMRCALVANSEQLLGSSNRFDTVDWTAENVTVESGWMSSEPVTGVASGGWKMYANTNVNTEHSIEQTIVRTNTEDMFTASIYGTEGDADFKLRVRMESGADYVEAIVDLNDGSVASRVESGFMRMVAESFHMGSNLWRTRLTADAPSAAGLTAKYTIVNTDDSVQYTGNGSAGIEIFGAQLTRFPFLKQYVETDSGGSVVGSGWQDGSDIWMAGFSSGDVITAGQRFEIVNQFHSNSEDLFERSEFKRGTREVIASPEGMAHISFDPPIRNMPKYARSGNSFFAGATMHNPVIFHQPELKARLVAGSIQYVDKALLATDMTFNIIEDMTE